MKNTTFYFKKAIIFDIKPMIQKLKIPILILWGGADKMTPVDAVHIMCKLNPNAKFVIYKNICFISKTC